MENLKTKQDVMLDKINETKTLLRKTLFYSVKKKILSKLSAIGTTITLFAIKANMVFAAETGGSGIGTAEVQTATENIKRVITSIAMPLRWCSNFCKCSSCSN